jgi:hypothetical protein
MGPLAGVEAAAAGAVIVASLVAPLAAGRRGLALAAVVAGVGGQLVTPAMPEPLFAAFAGLAVTLAGYLLLVAGRRRQPRDRWVRVAGATFTVVGGLGGAALAAVDPAYPLPIWPVAAAGALFAAAIVLLTRSDDPPAMACGVVLALVGSRVVLLQLGGSLTTFAELGLDAAMVGAAASALIVDRQQASVLGAVAAPAGIVVEPRVSPAPPTRDQPEEGGSTEYRPTDEHPAEVVATEDSPTEDGPTNEQPAEVAGTEESLTDDQRVEHSPTEPPPSGSATRARRRSRRRPSGDLP